MTKLLVFAAAALFIFGSCSNDDELNQTGSNNGDAIEFRTLIDKGVDSRAAVTNADNMLSFTVTGMWENGTVAEHNLYLFNATPITRGEDGKWTYTPKQYLPVDGRVDFYAYSPAASKNITLNKGIKDYVANARIEYTVPQIGKLDAQEDFLVAKRTGIKNAGTGATNVKLNFHHALSRVKFYGRKTKEDITYAIGEIALVNLYPTGTLNLCSEFITEDAVLDHTKTDKWATVSTTPMVDYNVDMGDSPIMLPYDATDATTKEKFYSLLGETNDILVLPQTTVLYKGDGKVAPPVGGSFAICVKYQAYDKRGTYYAGSEGKYETVYFSVDGGTTDADGIEFEMERQYNFYLTFGNEVGDPISLSATVSGWVGAE